MLNKEYDFFADKYAKFAKDETESRNEFYEMVPKDVETILDVGCGSGQDALYYAAQGLFVYGVDISSEEVRMANATFSGSFLVGDMANLPYGKNEFDTVASVYALQASDKVTQSLTEMIRVVKPGGLVSVLTKHPFRNLIEGLYNHGSADYFNQRKEIDSHIFGGNLTVKEPGHTMMEYLSPVVLSQAKLVDFREREDFPFSEQVRPDLIHPTYMILQYEKNK